MIGVVIGKFYPPHRGHKFLIDSALGQVDELTVIVCDLPGQSISAEQRAEWLREIHPSAKVVVTPDDLPDEPEPWAKRTIEILGGRPDVVFTSETYGNDYARAMGCRQYPRNSTSMGRRTGSYQSKQIDAKICSESNGQLRDGRRY